MNILKKIDRAFEWGEEWILVITGTAVGIMILANAACRFLKIDWFGSEELTLFVAMWLYFVGSICASRDGTHISADMMSLFTKNEKVLDIIGIIKNVIGLVVCGMMTLWCYNYVSWQANLGAKSAIYKLPVVIATIPILISFAFWMLYLIRDIVVNIQHFRGKNEVVAIERETGSEGGK